MIETAEERAAFFSPEEFGVKATLLPGSATSREIDVIFDAEFVGVDPSTGAEVSSASPQFQCRSADVADLKQRQEVEIEGRVYTVADVRPDGTGISTVILYE